MRALVIMMCGGAMTFSACVDEGTATVVQKDNGTCESWEADSAPHTLWPPNHKLFRFSLDNCVTISDVPCNDLPPDPGMDGKPTHLYTASAPVHEVRLHLTSITSNEPIDVGHGGDGHTTNFDARIIDDTHFELRAERQGAQSGRTYTVNFVDQDGVAGFCTYVVPHSNGTCSH